HGDARSGGRGHDATPSYVVWAKRAVCPGDVAGGAGAIRMPSSHSCSLWDGPHKPAPYTLGGRRGVLRWGTRDSSAGCVGGARGATGTILAISARHVPRDPFSMWASRLHSRRELR